MFMVISGYFMILSIMAFAMMKIDKRQAQRRGQRIPEKNLWAAALLGGGIGAYAGMMTFRHKTRRAKFRIGFLLLAAIDTALWVWSYQTFGQE
ncbi:DUF1294 domain-containing protein [Planococcus salinus]|uniref:DUF1294 domain-containing protein n=1 Tax=Planococcus salinus TaxID=1848460 RepID=A0A3M8PB17_9BACL|nr:DUF1294 domain-containing protein [Planococcus salinus]RNF40875.1 DUF1294 domain-containing protein [Planococcus salinus]